MLTMSIGAQESRKLNKSYNVFHQFDKLAYFGWPLGKRANLPFYSQPQAGKILWQMDSLYDRIQESIRYISSQVSEKPAVGVVLGSGWWNFIKELDQPQGIDFSNIPHFLPTHLGKKSGGLIIGRLGQLPVACLIGRLHTYEGFTVHEVAYPVRVLGAWGIKVLFVTNAAGGINPRFSPEDLMLICDHINMTGENPLKGEEEEKLGQRFLDMTRAYDPTFIRLARAVARKLGIKLRKGVYVGVNGPVYETPAEVKMYASLGADAVGMSTVAEVVAARQMGIRVCGLSCITNRAASFSSREITHEEVLSIMERTSEKAFRFLKELIIAGVDLPKEETKVIKHG